MERGELCGLFSAFQLEIPSFITKATLAKLLDVLVSNNDLCDVYEELLETVQ